MTFLKEGKTNWRYILIVLILAAIVGGGILGYQEWISREETKIPEIKLPEKRILIDQKRWDEQFDNPIDLGEKFNTDPPTTKVLYSNSEKGISLYLPYNPKWGTEKYKILPYYLEESCPREIDIIYNGSLCEGGISFAPPAFFGTRQIPKDYFVDYMNEMFFLPARNAEEITASLYYSKGGPPHAPDPGVLKNTVTKDTINNISVVKYTFIGPDVSPIIEVIGKKYNYLFTCSLCKEEDREIGEEVIRTIKFIE